MFKRDSAYVSRKREHKSIIGKEDPRRHHRSKRDVNCVICLGVCDDVTVLPTCVHKFCFTCIQRWLIQKAVCPLCKTRIHEVKHRLSYTSTPSWSTKGSIVSTRTLVEQEDFSRLEQVSRPFTSEQALIEEAIVKLKEAYNDRRFHLSMGIIKHYIHGLMSLKAQIDQMQRTDLCRHSLFRFVIYFTDADRTNLIATSSDLSLDAETIKANRAQFRSEWMPFVARDIRAITKLEALDTDKIMTLILDAFESGASNKRDALFTHLKSLGVEHPRTFYKNVQSFGSANQSIDLYDANSCYEPRRQLSDAFRDDDHDVHIVFAAPTAHDSDVEIVGSTSTNAYYQVHQAHQNLLRSIPSLALAGQRRFHPFWPLPPFGRAPPPLSLPLASVHDLAPPLPSTPQSNPQVMTLDDSDSDIEILSE